MFKKTHTHTHTIGTGKKEKVRKKRKKVANPFSSKSALSVQTVCFVCSDWVLCLFWVTPVGKLHTIICCLELGTGAQLWLDPSLVYINNIN